MQATVREHLRMHLLATLGIPPGWLWWYEWLLDFEEEERISKVNQHVSETTREKTLAR